MRIDINVHSTIEKTIRTKQLESMFEVPASEKTSFKIGFDADIDSESWNIGLIVGPSGCGKSMILNKHFGKPVDLEWKSGAVVNSFDEKLSIQQITTACQSVGFNTIPAWLRPFHVLSNGEQFRAAIARRILELDGIITIDEFTSVVDRQVAKIASHAIQKFVRKEKKQLVVAACHYDIVDWLQPDWIIEPASQSFTRRSLRQRPEIEVTIKQVPYSVWAYFAPFHYMSATMHKAARCYGLFIGDTIAAFCGVMNRPISRYGDDKRNIIGISRVVTLPDYQGIGLAFVLMDVLGSAYNAKGLRFRNYPGHPPFIQSHKKNKNWKTISNHGFVKQNHKSTGSTLKSGGFGGGNHAVFEYCGPAMTDKKQAERLVGSDTMKLRRMFK